MSFGWMRPLGRSTLFLAFACAAPGVLAGLAAAEELPSNLPATLDGAGIENVAADSLLAPRIRAWTAFGLGLQAEFDLNFKQALRHYQEAESLGSADPQFLVRKASCLLELRRFDSALLEARRALAADSTLSEAHWIAGASEAGMERYEAAIGPLEAAVRLQPDVRALNMLVNVLERLDRYEDALEPLNRLIGLAESSTLLYRRAQILERIGRLAEAAEDQWRIVEENPARMASVESLRRILTALERRDDLYRLQHLLIDYYPDQAEHRWELIRLLVEDERWDEAEAELLEFRERHPDDPSAAMQLGLVAYRKGETARGLGLFDEAWALAPDAPRVIRWRMRLMLAEGMLDSAIVNAERLVELIPQDAEGWRVLALGRAEMNDLDGALRALEQWAGIEKESPDPWLLMASIQRTRGQRDEALRCAREAFSRAPEEPDVLLEYASSLEETGRSREAEAMLLPLIEADSADARALNFVGYLWADHGERLDEAERLIRRALADDPDNPAFLDSMGWLWYKRGDLDQAEEWLQKAVDRGGRHPEIFEHLARVQIEKSRNREAAETLRRGIALTPESRELREMLDSLATR